MLAAAPQTVTLRFTEPLERSYSRASLYDQRGTAVAGATLNPGPDDYAMTLALPAGLPNGTYSVLWRTLSRADGHTAEGYLAFTVGTPADVAAVVIPSTPEGSGPPQWLHTGSRWAALVGLATLLASWPVWTLVVRPALAGARHVGLDVARRMRRFAAGAVVAALMGSVVALAVQAATLPEGNALDKLLNTLGQTRYGELWLWRVGLILLLAFALSSCAWWWPRRGRRAGAAAWLATLALPLPFSLTAHAAATEQGRATAVAADALHLLAASLWSGGLVLLSVVLFPALRRLPADERRGVLGVAVARFSTLALIAWSVLGLTGFYAGWLQVGTWGALTSTAYGRSLLVKLALLAVVLALAAVNLLVIGRRLRARAADAGESASGVWSRRLTLTVGLEVVLVLGVLLAAGQMTSLQPARDVVAERARQTSVAFTFAEGGRAGELLVAPGAAGVNHIRLEVDGAPLPAATEALLRLTLPAQAGMGTREVQLARVAEGAAGAAWEHHGSEFSIAGDWELSAILRPPAGTELRATSTLALGPTPAPVDLPGEVWRFEPTGGVVGLGLLVVGITGVVLAIFAGRTPLRKEGFGLGAAALAMGALLLLQARIDPALATAGNEGSTAAEPALLARGEAVYAANCASCHGAELRGDGPAAAGLQPPPADFLAPHALVHPDEDLLYWVRHGKQGTAMPAFGETLADEEIGAVLAYVRAQQRATDSVAQVPEPAACDVAPRTVESIEAVVGANGQPVAPSRLTTGSTPLPPAAVRTVAPATTAAVTAGVTELVACTNAGDTLRRLALFSDDVLRRSYPTGMTPGVARVLDQPPRPVPVAQRSALLRVDGIVPLADGRVSAVVVIDDPTTHYHPPADADPTARTVADPGATTATFIFTEQDGRWLIDEIV